MASTTLTPVLPSRSIGFTKSLSRLIGALGDLFIADIRAWREYRGGDWWRIRTNMHPQTLSWQQRPPDDDAYESQEGFESYPDRAARKAAVTAIGGPCKVHAGHFNNEMPVGSFPYRAFACSKCFDARQGR